MVQETSQFLEQSLEHKKHLINTNGVVSDQIVQM